MTNAFARSVVAVAFGVFAASSLRAQQGAAARMTAADSVFVRARQLVANGNGAAGRVLIDSVMTVALPETPVYVEAIYWRGVLAATSADAERDYRRIVVEYPLSRYAGDALLRLAQLEMARGERGGAITHLEQFLLENPQHAERPRAGLLLVRTAFDQNEMQRGCIALGRVLRDIPETAVELRNQLDYFSPRCIGVDTTRTAAVAAVDTVTRRDTTPARSTPSRASGRFTLQLAAYNSRSEATAFAKRLNTRGIEARVVGSAKPYRVVTGRYETRAAATAEQKKLKAKKIDTIIKPIGSDDR
jgi:hypothetical protein